MDVINGLRGDCYVICICEGTAEQDIIEWLLDEDKLIFKREDLLGKKIERSRTSKKIEESYLSLDYDKPVYLLRIIDSKNEKFTLSKLYRDRYSVHNVITNPEIEILMIIHNGDYAQYTNKNSGIKPSIFASTQYRIKGIKQCGVMRKVFENNIDFLIASMIEHKKNKGKNHLTIVDILK